MYWQYKCPTCGGRWDEEETDEGCCPECGDLTKRVVGTIAIRTWYDIEKGIRERKVR